MARKDQDPLFPTPTDMKKAARQAKAAERARLRLPGQYTAARDAVNAYCANSDATALITTAETALERLLDTLLFGAEPETGEPVALPVEFVELAVSMWRALDYQGSLESFLMHGVASNRVNPGYIFRAEWPGHHPNVDEIPNVLVLRVTY